MRPYIICHMMASVDGRIDCDMTEKLEGTNEYYDALEELDVPTTVSGRVTAALHYALPGAFHPADKTPCGKETLYKAVEAPAYSIVMDTRGTLLWEENHIDNIPLLCVVSEQASAEYLTYLKQKGISCIATGRECIDLPRVMELLAEEFGVQRVGVVGGGKINAAFLAAGLLDEMSLMIAPGIDGRSNQPSVFDGIAGDAEPFKLKMTGVKAFDCGTVWIRYQVIADKIY